MIEQNKEIHFCSKTMGNLIIKVVDKNIAKNIIIHNHYSKKWNNNFGVINVGIFKEGNSRCLGVASFGNMMNAKCFSKISDSIKQNEILELNRMWIDDILGKNAESILISNAFRIIKKEMPHVKIIQSFADGRLGCGTIYKATNFKYYGFSKTIFFKHKSTGEHIHKMMFEKTSRPKTMGKLCKQFVNNEFEIYEVKTYRYLYCLNKRLYKTIKLKELSYPKYEKSIKQIDVDFSLNNMTKAMIILKYLGDDEGENNIYNYLLNRYSVEEIEQSLKTSMKNSYILDFINKCKVLK